MANSFGLLLLAIVIVFIIARLQKDTKAFTTLMAILVVGLLVGAGAKAVVVRMTTANTPEKTVVLEKIPYSTHISTPFVMENGLASPECVSQNAKGSDNFSIQTEGLPTTITEIAQIDDS